MKPGVPATQHAPHRSSESFGHRRMMGNHPSVLAGCVWKKSVIERRVAELAHIGFYALLFSRLVGPGGTVFAFEPLPGNFDVLVENLALNQCRQVRAVNKAVMDRPRQIILYVPSADLLPGDPSARHSDGTIPLQVEAIQIDEFLSNQGLQVDLIKVDVEGAEENVLLGAREAIREYHPALVVELHHFDGDLSRHAVPGILESWGYKVRYLDRWEFTSHILAVWKGKPGVEDGQPC